MFKKYNNNQIIFMIVFSVYSLWGAYLDNFIISYLNYPIENIYFLIIILIFSIIFRNKLISFFSLKNNFDLFLSVSIILFILTLINPAIITYINSFGEQTIIKVSSEIEKISRPKVRSTGYFYLKIKNKLEKIAVNNNCYKVGDTYNVTIYEGWMGIKYYIPHAGWTYYESSLKCRKDKKDVYSCSDKINKNTKIFQCHNPKAKDFSFLSKYKNLEAIDLTGTVIKNLSFLKDLKKIKILLLLDTKVKNIEGIRHLKNLEKLYINSICNKNLLKLKGLKKLKVFNLNKGKLDFLPLNERQKRKKNALKLSKLFYKEYIFDDLGKYNSLLPSLYLYYNPNKLDLLEYDIDDICGIEQFKNLSILKINLNSNKNFKYILSLIHLKELHLSGSIKNISSLPINIKKLFLYNTKIEDFSFLTRTYIEELNIFTNSFRDKKWKILIKKYPKIKIKIKSLLFLPILNEEFYLEPKGKISDFCTNYKRLNKLSFIGGKLNISYCQYIIDKTIQNARKNNFCRIYKNGNIEFLKDIFDNFNIDFNAIYENETILDCVIGNNNSNFLKYLKKRGVKRACEILNNKCD